PRRLGRSARDRLCAGPPAGAAPAYSGRRPGRIPRHPPGDLHLYPPDRRTGIRGIGADAEQRAVDELPGDHQDAGLGRPRLERTAGDDAGSATAPIAGQPTAVATQPGHRSPSWTDAVECGPGDDGIAAGRLTSAHAVD